MELRAEQARLLGYETYADYRLADAMAKTPEAARNLLEQVWEPARRKAAAERAELAEAALATDSTRRSRHGTGATTPRRCGSGTTRSTKPS